MFSNEQRFGILLLIVLIIILQIGIYLNDWEFFQTKVTHHDLSSQWELVQNQIDSLKENQPKKEFKQYPFNPNFITDYKGYQLGMSTQELDRLFAFREKGLFINSIQDFKDVTKVSDSLLSKISPLFKFPDWVTARNNNKSTFVDFSKPKKEKIQPKDFNLATQEDFIAIKGIGEGISARILKERTSLGGFMSMQQVNDIWGLSPEVIEKLQESFFIKNIDQVKKIAINDWSVKELSAHPFFSYAQAKEIVIFRSMNEKIQNIEDLIKIKHFPVDKINYIALYLEF
jgi:DNA uptake protein ComE-like DNA-binding protein